MDDNAYRRRRRLVSVLSLLLFVGFLIGGTVLIGKPLVRFLDDPASFRAWAEGSVWGRPALVGIMVVQVIISLIPGGVVEIAAGTCYGGPVGGLLCLLGALLGSAVVFALVRKFGVPLAEAFVSREKIASLFFLQNTARLEAVLFILYLIPGTPKDVFNYFVGLTPVKPGRFLLISTLARAPAIFATTFCGDALFSGDLLRGGIIFAVTAVCSIAGLLLYRLWQKNKTA